jgi:hypothetical protein
MAASRTVPVAHRSKVQACAFIMGRASQAWMGHLGVNRRWMGGMSKGMGDTEKLHSRLRYFTGSIRHFNLPV